MVTNLGVMKSRSELTSEQMEVGVPVDNLLANENPPAPPTPPPLPRAFVKQPAATEFERPEHKDNKLLHEPLGVVPR